MKSVSTTLLILLVPLSLFAFKPLSESDLSNVITVNSLAVTSPGTTDGIVKSWSPYFNNPRNISFSLNEDDAGTTDTQAVMASSGILTDYAAAVSVVDADDPYYGGMSRIEFPNGLVGTSEGPTSMEIWLGGSPNVPNAGKMCDFYSDRIESFTSPGSSFYVSTHH